eukprot:3590750-Amphidinium_carterae.1
MAAGTKIHVMAFDRYQQRKNPRRTSDQAMAASRQSTAGFFSSLFSSLFLSCYHTQHATLLAYIQCLSHQVSLAPLMKLHPGSAAKACNSSDGGCM